LNYPSSNIRRRLKKEQKKAITQTGEKNDRSRTFENWIESKEKMSMGKGPRREGLQERVCRKK